MNRVVEIDRFKAVSDSGKEYTILVMRDMIDASSHDHADAWLPGMKHLITSTGLGVTRIDAETFKVSGSDEVFRKV